MAAHNRDFRGTRFNSRAKRERDRISKILGDAFSFLILQNSKVDPKTGDRYTPSAQNSAIESA